MSGAAPAVTVVVPCFKHGHYLTECLGSLTAQTRADWEAVVVDDASPDRELIASVVAALGDARVRLVHHDANRGLAAARNSGMGAARGALLLPLDADDLLAPNALELLAGELEARPELDAAYADVQLFGRADEVLVFSGPADGRLRRIADTIPGAGTLMRRVLWERLGGYDESDVLRAGREDFEFWMRAFSQGLRVARVAHPLYLYRVSHTSMSLACRREDHRVTEYMADKHAALFEDSAARRRFVAAGYARAALARHESGDRAGARRLARQALRRDPSMANLRLVARSFLAPSTARRLTGGEVRRRLPFVSYPLRGERRYAPFFVIGAARSGTTLVRRILTAHSQLHIPPETFVLGEILRGFRRWGRHLDWDELVGLVLSRFEFHPEFPTFQTRLGPLAGRLSHVPLADRNLAYLIDAFYRFHAEQGGAAKPRWGDKTPLNTLEEGTLERLLEVFPDARFLHVLRDGCDVVHSHLAGGFVRDLESAGERWVEMTRRARRFAAAHPERTLELRYEALVAEPESEIGRMCAFLGVEAEPGMLVSEEGAAALGDVPRWYWHGEVGRPIHGGNVGKGRRYLSPAELTALEAVIGRELAACGYPPADRPDPAAEGADG